VNSFAWAEAWLILSSIKKAMVEVRAKESCGEGPSAVAPTSQDTTSPSSCTGHPSFHIFVSKASVPF
jgi:hypothetical protein